MGGNHSSSRGHGSGSCFPLVANLPPGPTTTALHTPVTHAHVNRIPFSTCSFLGRQPRSRHLRTCTGDPTAPLWHFACYRLLGGPHPHTPPFWDPTHLPLHLPATTRRHSCTQDISSPPGLSSRVKTHSYRITELESQTDMISGKGGKSPQSLRNNLFLYRRHLASSGTWWFRPVCSTNEMHMGNQAVPPQSLHCTQAIPWLTPACWPHTHLDRHFWLSIYTTYTKQEDGLRLGGTWARCSQRSHASFETQRTPAQEVGQAPARSCCTGYDRKGAFLRPPLQGSIFPSLEEAGAGRVHRLPTRRRPRRGTLSRGTASGFTEGRRTSHSPAAYSAWIMCATAPTRG